MENSRNRPVQRIYEVGRVYQRELSGLDDGSGGHLPRENRRLCGALYDGRAAVKPGRMFYQVKGILEDLLELLRLAGARPEKIPAGKLPGWMHPVHSAGLFRGGLDFGVFGELHPAAGRRLGLGGTLGIFELDLDALLEAEEQPLVYRPLPRFPDVLFDLSVVVPQRTEMETVKEVILAANPELIKEVNLQDVYRGSPVPAGKKSLFFSILCRSAEQTLDQEQAAAVHGAIIAAVKQAGWSLRD
jgi:phenylalanyl-tRNA synthetase beta chain